MLRVLAFLVQFAICMLPFLLLMGYIRIGRKNK